jgi:hypothetical protein
MKKLFCILFFVFLLFKNGFTVTDTIYVSFPNDQMMIV